jgi:hypothetical protein
VCEREKEKDFFSLLKINGLKKSHPLNLNGRRECERDKTILNGVWEFSLRLIAFHFVLTRIIIIHI